MTLCLYKVFADDNAVVLMMRWSLQASQQAHYCIMYASASNNSRLHTWQRYQTLQLWKYPDILYLFWQYALPPVFPGTSVLRHSQSQHCMLVNYLLFMLL
jgi:hypothetical protein